MTGNPYEPGLQGTSSIMMDAGAATVGKPACPYLHTRSAGHGSLRTDSAISHVGLRSPFCASIDLGKRSCNLMLKVFWKMLRNIQQSLSLVWDSVPFLHTTIRISQTGLRTSDIVRQLLRYFLFMGQPLARPETRCISSPRGSCLLHWRSRPSNVETLAPGHD